MAAAIWPMARALGSPPAKARALQCGDWAAEWGQSLAEAKGYKCPSPGPAQCYFQQARLLKGRRLRPFVTQARGVTKGPWPCGTRRCPETLVTSESPALAEGS